MYSLNKDDIREVETWYARRYPKLTKFADVHEVMSRRGFTIAFMREPRR